jgi:hypothetical protein
MLEINKGGTAGHPRPLEDGDFLYMDCSFVDRIITMGFNKKTECIRRR